MNSLLTPQSVKLLYSTFINKKKERFDIILEPLQALLQIALLKFCPIGTKIAIQNNLLELQLPGYSQGILRWYNNDNKEDLFYLFNAFRRFTSFYGFLRQYKYSNDELTDNNLYDLLVDCAKEGLNKLSQTYSNVDKISLLHTLQMYKVILDNPGFFDVSPSGSPLFSSNNTPKVIDNLVLTNDNNGKKKDTSSSNSVISNEPMEFNIDNIFVNIRNLYSKELIKAIMNIMLLLTKCEESDTIYYIECLDRLLFINNSKIKKWINDNIVF